MQKSLGFKFGLGMDLKKLKGEENRTKKHKRSSIEEVKYKPCPMKLQDQTIWRIWKGTGDHSGAAVDDSA